MDNVQQYSASNPPPYPVTSVNGATGAVTIDSSVSMTDAEVDAAVEAAFAYTITNESPTLVSVQSSASAGETVSISNINNGNNGGVSVSVGTTTHGYDVKRWTLNSGGQFDFTMPDAPVFVSAYVIGGSND